MEELLPKISNCFDFLCVHRGLLEDQYRLKAYQSAIKKVVKKGDIVIDIGTGTGILAFLAVKAGAKRVYAIEKSNIIKLAKQIAIENQIDSRITFIKGDSRRIKIPKIKADVLITELVGHYALDENLLDIVIDGRQRFLKKEGKVIPNAIKLYMSPINCSEICRDVNFWKRNILGFNYESVLKLALNNIYTEIPNNLHYLALPKMVHNVNLHKVIGQKVEIAVKFHIRKTGFFHGFIGWFELLLAPGVNLLTHPDMNESHWEPVFFPVPISCKVKPKDKIELNLLFETVKDKIFMSWWGGVWRNAKEIVTFSQSTRKIYL